MHARSLLLVATAALLAGCNSKDGSSSPDGAAGGTVIITPPEDAHSIFPPHVEYATDRWVQDQVFDRLAEINHDLVTIGDKGFTPQLAEKWTWASDSMSIAFSINPRARWHDGKPVTANDVRYSFKAFTDPKTASPNASVMANLDSVSVRDSLTAVVWFKKHTPEQFYDVAYQLLIIPEHVYGAIPMDKLRTSDVTKKPIGSGRFRFVRWDAGTRIELVADTGNYRGRAKLDRLIFTPADAVTASTQILSGQSDFMEAFPTDRVDALDSSTVAHAVRVVGFGYAYMVFNRFDPKVKTAPHPIFSDVRVRRALSKGVDRVAMLQNVFGKDGHLSYGPFPMTVPFADSSVKVPPYDTIGARALLDSAGWVVGKDGIRAKAGRPLRFGLVYPSTSLFRKRYSVMIQDQLKKIGAQVDLDEVDGKTAPERADNATYDALMWTFSTDPSPSGSVQSWATNGGQNKLKYSNKKVDALLDSAVSAFDAAKVKSYASRAFQLIVDDAPAIFLYDINVVYGANRRIELAPFRPDAWWASMADWTIPAGKQIDRDRIGLSSAKP